MSEKIGFAIVGTNFISDRFAEAVITSDVAELTAVCSRKFDTGSAFAEKYGIKSVYTDYAEMLLDSRVDAVYIASPNKCHAEQTVLALEGGKHVLCEKAIASDMGGFLLQKRAQEHSGKVLLEAMRPDFDPAFDIIKKNIAKIGKIRRVNLEYCQYSSRYDRFKSGEILNAFDSKLGNSALADIGIYPLHMCVALFGAPRSVDAHSLLLSNGFEGMGNIFLSYDDMCASIVYSKITESVNPSVIEGEDGSLTFDKINAPSKIILHMRGAEPTVLDYTPAANNMIYELNAFCKAIGGDLNFKRYLKISETTLGIIDAAYKMTGADKYFS